MIFADYPGHLIAILLLVVFAALMVFAFRSRQSQKAKLWRPVLCLLQYASIVILLLICWNPSQTRNREVTSRNSVLVLFDTSQSMSVVEEGTMNRLDKALKVFREKFSPGDPDVPTYQIYGFDNKCYSAGAVSLEDGAGLKRWGEQTNLHNVFGLLARYNSQEITRGQKGKIVGAVVFSDGQADDKNASGYVPLGSKDLQVVFVGVGSKEPYSDVSIKSMKAPTRVAIDTAYTVEVVTSARNLQNRSVTVELLKDDYVVASQEVSAETLNTDYVAEFEVGADRLGRHRLSARASAGEDELNSANNARSTMVEVVENKKLRVLFYSQVANFNIGKVRQALVRDEKILLDFGLGAIINPALADKAQKQCGHVKLPADRVGFYDYDVIVLGPCAIDSLTAAQIDGLYSFVVDRGGGLVLLPGQAQYGLARWRNEKIKTLVPTFLKTEDETTGGHISRQIVLTLDGLASKVISQADLEEYDMLASAYYNNIDKKPAAKILACARREPIIYVHRVGRGRVCLLNASRLYSWYREELGGGLLQKMMCGITGYLGTVTSREAGIELFAQRVAERTGIVRFDAYIYDRSFAPVSGATVLLSIGEQVLRMDQVEKGHYVAEVENIIAEAVVATAQAEADSVFLGEKTIAVNLPAIRSEMAEVELDSKFLQSLAKRVSGKYFDIDRVDKDIVEMFEATSPISSVTGIVSVWPRWVLLLALCLILSVNWCLRRAIGLV